MRLKTLVVEFLLANCVVTHAQAPRAAQAQQPEAKMWTTPWDEVNSVMSKPQEPCARMSLRKMVSVTPAIGARTVAGAMEMGPMWNPEGKGVLTPLHCSGEGRVPRNAGRLRYVE